MNCYIFGAGASKCYDQSPTSQKMPLAKEFFKVFNCLEISANPWVLVGNVINYVENEYGISPFEFIDFNEDIETFHSQIYEKFITAQLKNDFIDIVKYNGVNNQLTFMFVSALNEIQNGPISNAHINFVNTLHDDDSIITFNWDTLLDRALSQSGRWFTDSGYSIIPRQIYNDGWREPNYKRSAFELIKLHGSTNWITSYPIWNKDKLIFTHTTGDHDVFVYEQASHEYSCYDGRYMAGYEPFSYGYYPPNLLVDSIKAEEGHIFGKYTLRNGMNVKGSAPSNGITSIPLIITPIKKKEYGRFGDLFDVLWRKASDKIEKADRIFIIGYSFPTTDTKTNDLFVSSLERRRKIPDVVIINPFPEPIVNKFIFEYGIPIDKIRIDKCYIRSDYDFNKWNFT